MLQQILPPFIYNALRKQPAKQKTKLYTSYSEALKDCTTDAYQEKDLVRVIVEKAKAYILNPTKEVETRALSLINTILQINKPVINIIDFGGSCGAYYFEVKQVIEGVKLNYIVVETPEMVRQAKPVFSSDELTFTTELNEAQSKLGIVDIIYASGSIQFVDEPYTYLQRLIDLRADYILFGRLGLSLGTYDITIVHENMLSWNGAGPLPSGVEDRLIKYPCHFIRKESFMKLMEKDYKLLYSYTDTSGVFPVNDEPLEGMGMLWKLR